MNRVDVLWQLQLVDLDLDEARKQLQVVESRLGESRELLQAREAVREVEGNLRSWQARLRDWELELESLENKVQATEDRLYGGRVTNPKELASLQQDAEYLKRRRGELEDRVLLAMTEIDNSESLFRTRQEELRKIEGAWAEEQAQLRETKARLEAQVNTLMTRRAELGKVTGQEDLQIYEELRRKKGGRAVTSLRGDLCEGCRVAVPTAKMQLIRRRIELIFCGGCGRILYAE